MTFGNGSDKMTHTNVREWSLDRILVIVTLLVSLMTGGALLININTKLENFEIVKEKVIQLEVKVDNLQEDLKNERDLWNYNRQRSSNTTRTVPQTTARRTTDD